MTQLPVRRFQKLYERILLSQWLSLVLGWLFVGLLPNLLYSGLDSFQNTEYGQQSAFWINTVLYLISFLAIRRLLYSFPGGRSLWLVLSHVFVIFALGVFVSLFFRIQVSRLVLMLGGSFALIWFSFEHQLNLRYRQCKLAVIQKGFALQLLELGGNVDIRPLEGLSLGEYRYDGVVADFRAMNADEERFLTQCALQGIPVYNAKDVFESFTGRVKIDYMSENNIGSLLPSRTVENFKTLFDLSIILLTLPFTILICLITAICIRMESPGPVIYSQARIGKGNKPFTIYKFRSMRFDREATQQFASEDDPRITRVGKIIRKLRIDELPQLLNIIKGEMSLIGPRPEQPAFVEEFDQQIPFYSYRHVVKPGISGWAQVRHGYAADADETQVKIEHDFFYIKNYSITLDIFIALLTLRTMLTGFGAR